MTNWAFNKVFSQHGLNYKLKGDIQKNDEHFPNGDLTVENNSIVIHDSKGTSQGAFTMDEVISARLKGDESSTIVIMNDTMCTTINIKLHPVGTLPASDLSKSTETIFDNRIKQKGEY